MTAPGSDLVRAVRAGCLTIYPDCTFPSKECDRFCVGFLKPIRAALAELAEPSEEMLAAVPDYRHLADHCWRAIMRKVLGGQP